jgi:hypothetical protein
MSPTAECADPAQWVSLTDIARRANVHYQTASRWLRRGLLPEPHRINCRCLRWPPEVLDRLPELLANAG